MVHIRQFTFSPFQENTSLLYTDSGQCWIIDPGCYSAEEKQILKGFIEENDLTPTRLLNTHCHLDHVFGNAFVHRTYGLLPEYDQRDESTMQLAGKSAELYGIPGFEDSPACENYISEKDQLELDGHPFEVRFCPGHAPGHLVFISHEQRFVIGGDVLFQGSIGRTDLPGGNHQQLLDSIARELYSLDDDYQVYSGHGPVTNIGHEKKAGNVSS